MKPTSTDRRRLMSAALAATAGAAAALAPARAAKNGINSLIAVAQQKAEEANEQADAASASANRQRALLAKEKVSRNAKDLSSQQAKQLVELKGTIRELQGLLAKIKDAGC